MATIPVNIMAITNELIKLKYLNINKNINLLLKFQ